MGDFNAKLEIEKEGMKQNQSRNGKLLYQLLETTGMTTVNTRREHIGTWTRVNTSNANEKSIIDYMLSSPMVSGIKSANLKLTQTIPST